MKHTQNIACVILAAGKGTRMKSDIPKPLHEVHSRPMLGYLLDTVFRVGLKKIILVLGHGAEEIKALYKNCENVLQSRPLGSGDAVNAARRRLKDHSGDILVLYSDTPLIRAESVLRLIEAHNTGGCACTILSGTVSNPRGYGRVIRDEEGRVVGIVEEKDATHYEAVIKEVNIGAYMFKKDALFENLDRIKINQKKKEYYLTDIVNILKRSGERVGAVTTDDEGEAIGINSRNDLARANEILNARVLREVMEKGVTVVDPSSTRIDCSAVIGPDTVIHPNTVIEKDVRIGTGCSIGPFSHLRPGTDIASNVEIGNFTELVRTSVGSGCKIKHKSYLGDAVVGEGVNIGAGTITANFDGGKKSRTVIKNDAFIGVGSVLIAPVTIGRGSVVGAGTVVTKRHDVPDGATVIGIPARVIKKSGNKRKK